MNKEPLLFYSFYCYQLGQKYFPETFFIFNNIFSFYLALLFVVDIKHSRKCFYLLYYIFGESKFFSMCQGMTRSACAFDAQDLCNTTGVISMCIRFFSFFLNSYDPNIGRTMTSFSNIIN